MKEILVGLGGGGRLGAYKKLSLSFFLGYYKPKHKIRAKVEHSFALIKTTMKQSHTRFTGLLRNNLNFTLICIAANLKLFAQKQIKLQKVGNI